LPEVHRIGIGGPGGREGSPTAVKMTPEIRTGDTVRLHKPHPCGSYEWEIVRVGADIGLRCLKCQRKVFLLRSTFERRVKEYVQRNNADADSSARASEDI
jgi:hypothetical protein